MCRGIVNHCEEYKNKIVFLVKNEKGKYEYKYNPSKKESRKPCASTIDGASSSTVTASEP